MRDSIVRRKIAAGEPCLITTLHFFDPSLFEMVSLLGIDCIWIDTEHHARANDAVDAMIRATRSGNCDVMVRAAKGEYMQLGRFLEMGATGILYPRCADAAEAAEVVAWSKFPPEGRRGFDGANPDMPYLSLKIEDYIARANRETFIGIQVEDDDALGQAEAIAAVAGVDFLFFGPADYSIQHGCAGQFDHPAVQSALERISTAAANTGKTWGCPVSSMEGARRVIDMGARIVTSSSDIGTLRRAYTDLLVSFRSIVEPVGTGKPIVSRRVSHAAATELDQRRA